MQSKQILVETIQLGSGFDIKEIKIPNDIKLIEKVLLTATYTGDKGAESGLSHCESSISYPNWNNADFQNIPINLNNEVTIKRDAFDVNIPCEYLKSKIRIITKKLTQRPMNAHDLEYKIYLICS